MADRTQRPPILYISQATLGAAVMADLSTSRHGYERTALYRSPEGRCEEKCAAIRLGVYGGTMLLQRFVSQRTDNKYVRRLFIGMNIFGTAAGFKVAAENAGVARKVASK